MFRYHHQENGAMNMLILLYYDSYATFGLFCLGGVSFWGRRQPQKVVDAWPWSLKIGITGEVIFPSKQAIHKISDEVIFSLEQAVQAGHNTLFSMVWTKAGSSFRCFCSVYLQVIVQSRRKRVQSNKDFDRIFTVMSRNIWRATITGRTWVRYCCGPSAFGIP